MAAEVAKTQCTICGKGKALYKCEGCQQSFCFNHLVDHNREQTGQLDQVENESNLFKQNLNQYQQNLSQHPLIEQINQWEQDSIDLVRQTADDARQSISKYTTEQIPDIEIQLNKLTNEMKELRNENDFNENNLDHLRIELDKLRNQLNQPNRIRIRDDSTLIKKLHVISSFSKQPNLCIDAKWNSNAITVAGGNGQSDGMNQLNNPRGMDTDEDQTIYVADTYNHRIVEWKKGANTGRIVAGGNGRGNRSDQLNAPVDVVVDHENDALVVADSGNRRVVRWPRRNGQHCQTIISNIDCRSLAIDKNGHLYVSDKEKGEVRQWKTGESEGILVAGGNGSGTHRNQLCGPRSIFVDGNESVYVSDHGNHRIMKWIKGAKEGIIVAGGQGPGNSLTQLFEPHGVFVDRLETVYVADSENNRVMRWLKGSKQGEIVLGQNGAGNQSNQLNRPMHLSFDDENSLYVVYQYNHRIQKFLIA